MVEPKTLILGLGRSGVAAAVHLLQRGHRLILSDQRERDQLVQTGTWARLSEAVEKDPSLVEWALGGHPLSLLDRCQRLVVSPGASLHLDFLAQARERGIPLVGEIELAWKACPLPMVAVTGTNGKSTTCSLLGQIFSTSGVVGGNIGTPLLEQVSDLPEAVRWVVAEISSFQLETVHEFRPHIGVLTNITPDHLDHHKDLTEYRVAKSRLFAQMRAQDVAIFCADNQEAMEVAAELGEDRLPEWLEGFPAPRRGDVPKILTYSTDRQVEDGVSLLPDERGQRWVTRCRPAGTERLFLWDFPGLPGRAMESNGLAATLAALEAGFSVEEIQHELRRFQPLRYRMELSGEISGVKFINDSKATNIDSALSSARAFDGPLSVIVGGKDKGVDYSSLARGLAERKAQIFLIGEAAAPIGRCLKELGYGSVVHSETLEVAIGQAGQALSEGGTVLLAPACSSFDQFNSAEHRGEVFDSLVKEYIHGSKAS